MSTKNEIVALALLLGVAASELQASYEAFFEDYNATAEAQA
jgi:hypothetical protein